MNANTYLYQYSDFEDCGLYIGDTGKLACSPSKKLKNVYHLLYTNENLCLAQYNAQHGKGERSEINDFNEHICERLDELYEMLAYETYVPGKYKERKIHDPKERVLMIAPFFPDRIIHHCVINVLGEHWTHLFIENTYACIKGRGVHKCMLDVRSALMRDKKGTRFCLKTDIRKFYDNIDHAALKIVIRYTIADIQMLRLLDKIIDSNGKDKGLPIGNYTSQYLANLYLAFFDHWVKEVLAPYILRRFGVKLYYFRYMDDMVFLCESKEALHYVFDMTGLYLAAELKVEYKANWQIFPVDDRGIDYVGFLQNHYNVLLRKSILLKFYRKASIIAKKCPIKDESDIKHLFSSEYGWISRCSEVHKKNVFNKITNYGHKHFINGSFSRAASASDRPLQQRTGNISLQPQHKRSGCSGRRNGQYAHSQGGGNSDRQDVAVRQPPCGISQDSRQHL